MKKRTHIKEYGKKEGRKEEINELVKVKRRIWNSIVTFT